MSHVPHDLIAHIFCFLNSLPDLVLLASVNKQSYQLVTTSLRYQLIRLANSPKYSLQKFKKLVDEVFGVFSAFKLEDLDAEMRTNHVFYKRHFFPNRQKLQVLLNENENIYSSYYPHLVKYSQVIELSHPFIQYIRYFQLQEATMICQASSEEWQENPSFSFEWKPASFKTFPMSPMIEQLFEYVGRLDLAWHADNSAGLFEHVEAIQKLLIGHPFVNPANKKYYMSLLRSGRHGNRAIGKVLWDLVVCESSLQDHRELVLAALRSHRDEEEELKILERYLHDEEVMEAYIDSSAQSVMPRFISSEWKKDKVRMMRLVQKNPRIYEFLAEELKRDPDVIRATVKKAYERKYPGASKLLTNMLPIIQDLRHALDRSTWYMFTNALISCMQISSLPNDLPPECLQDARVARQLIELSEELYPHIPDSLIIESRELALACAEQVPVFFQLTGRSFHTHYGNDDAIVRLVLHHDPCNILLCHPRFLTSWHLRGLLTRHPSAIERLPREVRYDPNNINCGLQNATSARALIRDAPESLKKDLAFVKKVFMVNPTAAIQYASKELLHDRDFCKFAVSISGCTIQHFAEVLRDDEEIALMALQNTASSFKFISKRLQHHGIILRVMSKFQPGSYICKKVRRILSGAKCRIISVVDKISGEPVERLFATSAISQTTIGEFVSQLVKQNYRLLPTVTEHDLKDIVVINQAQRLGEEDIWGVQIPSASTTLTISLRRNFECIELKGTHFNMSFIGIRGAYTNRQFISDMCRIPMAHFDSGWASQLVLKYQAVIQNAEVVSSPSSKLAIKVRYQVDVFSNNGIVTVNESKSFKVPIPGDLIPAMKKGKKLCKEDIQTTNELLKQHVGRRVTYPVDLETLMASPGAELSSSIPPQAQYTHQ